MFSLTPVVLLIVAVYLLSSIKILAEYERAVIFRLGRVLAKPKGPGLILVFRPIDRMVRVSLRLETLEVPAQDVVTRDNVTVKVSAVLFFRVLDPFVRHPRRAPREHARGLEVAADAREALRDRRVARDRPRERPRDRVRRHRARRRREGRARGFQEDSLTRAVPRRPTRAERWTTLRSRRRPRT